MVREVGIDPVNEWSTDHEFSWEDFIADAIVALFDYGARDYYQWWELKRQDRDERLARPAWHKMEPCSLMHLKYSS